MARRSLRQAGLAIALTAAAAGVLVTTSDSGPAPARSWRRGQSKKARPLLAILSPPGAGYDSTNIALSTANGTAVTISRASTQTCEVSPGVLTSIASNKPCVASGSLVVEPAGTNLVASPNDFTATWSVVNSAVTANATTAPDGTLTADKLSETAVAGVQHRIDYVTASTAANHVFSVYAKAAERSKMWLRIGASNGYTFDLSNCTTIAATAGGVSGSAASVGSGWCRLSFVGLAALNDTVRINTLDAAASNSYDGVAGNGIYLWCGQPELGTVATSCMASASRAAQATSVPTPAAWTSTPGKGSVTLRYCPTFSGNPPDNKILFDSRATIANGITVFALPVGTVGVDVVGNSVTVSARSAAVTWTAGQCKTIAARFTSAGCAFISVDGVETGGSCDVNAVPLSHGASLFIGSRFTAVNQALGTISSLRVCSSPDGCR